MHLYRTAFPPDDFPEGSDEHGQEDLRAADQQDKPYGDKVQDSSGLCCDSPLFLRLLPVEEDGHILLYGEGVGDQFRLSSAQPLCGGLPDCCGIVRSRPCRQPAEGWGGRGCLCLSDRDAPPIHQFGNGRSDSDDGRRIQGGTAEGTGQFYVHGVYDESGVPHEVRGRSVPANLFPGTAGLHQGALRWKPYVRLRSRRRYEGKAGVAGYVRPCCGRGGNCGGKQGGGSSSPESISPETISPESYCSGYS